MQDLMSRQLPNLNEVGKVFAYRQSVLAPHHHAGGPRRGKRETLAAI
jgi:hypothetical protein